MSDHPPAASGGGAKHESGGNGSKTNALGFALGSAAVTAATCFGVFQILGGLFGFH